MTSGCLIQERTEQCALATVAVLNISLMIAAGSQARSLIWRNLLTAPSSLWSQKFSPLDGQPRDARMTCHELLNPVILHCKSRRPKSTEFQETVSLIGMELLR